MKQYLLVRHLAKHVAKDFKDNLKHSDVIYSMKRVEIDVKLTKLVKSPGVITRKLLQCP